MDRLEPWMHVPDSEARPNDPLPRLDLRKKNLRGSRRSTPPPAVDVAGRDAASRRAHRRPVGSPPPSEAASSSQECRDQKTFPLVSSFHSPSHGGTFGNAIVTGATNDVGTTGGSTGAATTVVVVSSIFSGETGDASGLTLNGGTAPSTFSVGIASTFTSLQFQQYCNLYKQYRRDIGPKDFQYLYFVLLNCEQHTSAMFTLYREFLDAVDKNKAEYGPKLHYLFVCLQNLLIKIQNIETTTALDLVVQKHRGSGNWQIDTVNLLAYGQQQSHSYISQQNYQLAIAEAGESAAARALVVV
ncbi:hypothetical protein Cgig2_007361 [Carnegiea gigantea]|uniref:Uncharacterized protein n=1 Tax=Carnegiea gigantea TaxID=171969 RepID=A0A9Q1KZR3_9CARY|nr:hypothetical protein Cgig2_007361 [Carnegiea gigantea]